MTPLKSFVSSVLATCLVVSPAISKPRPIEAMAGKPVMIGHHVSFVAHCADGPVPWINIVEKPSNGEISTDLGPVRMGHSVVGSTTCDGKTGRGLIVLYTARPGFHGVDHLAYRVDYFPRGNANYAIDINVK
jgi:hypothetical protein